MTDERVILRRRAERLARRTGDEVRGSLFARVAIVAIAGQRFGLDVEGLRQIVAIPAITPLPTDRPWLRGIAQVRGELLGVVDLAKMFGQTSAPTPWLAILTAPQGAFGVCIEQVVGFRDVLGDELLSDIHGADRPITAVTRDLLAILDVPRLARLQRDEPERT